MLVTIHCTYPVGIDDSMVSFEPLPELGSTPEEVHERIVALIGSGEDFELEGVGEKTPVLFAKGTIRQVVVR